MSEQNADVPKIDWSQETDFSKIEYAEQLKDAARDCKDDMFADLLKGFAAAEAEDSRKGIDFIKEGVAECKNAQEKAAKKALVADFEGQPAAVEQEEAPAAKAAEEVVAPAKETAPAKKTSAADKKEISDLQKDFRAAISRIETLETRVISQAAEIETLKSGKEEDKAALAELAASIKTVEEGVVTLFNSTSDRIQPLEAAAQAKAKDKDKINTFRPA